MAYITYIKITCDKCGVEIPKDSLWYKIHSWRWTKVKEFKEGDLPEEMKMKHLCKLCGQSVMRTLKLLEIDYEITPNAFPDIVKNKIFTIWVDR